MVIKEALHQYSYRIRWRQIFNILLGIGLIGSALFLLLHFDIDTTCIVLVTVFLILGIIPLFISFHFFIVSKGLDIIIQTDKGLIEITQNGGKFTSTLDDIASIEIYEHKGLGLYEFEFDYAKYSLKNGKHFIVTSFMTSEYYIPSDIEPRLKQVFLPIIWERTNL
jgi:hypothetical protein